MKTFKPSKDENDQGFNNPENLKYSVISLDGDPEAVAEDLIRDSLPKTFFNEIDISTDEGFSQLIACLMLRMHQCSMEKDEIIEFTQKNKLILKERLIPLEEMIKVMKTMNDPGAADMIFFFSYFFEQVNYCLAGKEHLVNIKSDRLLWLLYALASQLASRKISYKKALDILSKPIHRNRISLLSIQFMLKDFAESIGTPNTPHTEYLMLVTECGLKINDANAVSAVTAILPKLQLPVQREALQDLLQRSIVFLKTKNKPIIEAESFLSNLHKRFDNKISDDDL